jgi:hypothetical protein
MNDMCEVKTKVCIKCGEDKPLTTEYFPKRKDSKDGFRNDCKICSNRYHKERHQIPEIKKQRSDYQKNNRQRCNFNKRKSYYKHRDKKINYGRKYRRKKYNEDPFYKMKSIIRCRVARFIDRKTKSTSQILGCDWQTFKKHIQNQFQEGMTWDNHGEWHYDHIIPMSSAQTEEEVYKLNHYTNIQPLWAEDNLKKSDKISEEWGNL